jgi:probable rRNA maturation factor
MIRINREKSFRRIADSDIVRAVGTVLKGESGLLREDPKRTCVTVNLVSDTAITLLNRAYRKRKGPTDILSFNFNEQEGRVWFLGELYLSVDTLLRQAKEYGHSAVRELDILLVHGTLHLLGYEHHAGPAKKKAMNVREKSYLKLLDKKN